MPTKPTGSLPTLRITVEPKKSSTKLIDLVNFASDKEDIEKQIVDLFVKTTSKIGFIFLKPPIQNRQDDFDFSLTLGCDVNLELTEFVIRETAHLPYKTNKTTRTCGEIHDAFIKTIENKIEKADKRIKNMIESNTPVLQTFLLVYTTHADYNIDNVVIYLLQHSLKNKLHPFEKIFLLQPITKDDAEMRLLFPYRGPIVDSTTLLKLRENTLINLL